MSTWKEMSDEQLALLYANGNNKAFDILLSRVQNKLFSYIFCMVKNEEMANDLFQETFIKAIVKLRDGKYKDNGKFLFWILCFPNSDNHVEFWPNCNSRNCGLIVHIEDNETNYCHNSPTAHQYVH